MKYLVAFLLRRLIPAQEDGFDLDTAVDEAIALYIKTRETP